MGHEGQLLLYLCAAIFLKALQISVELIQCTVEKNDLEIQKTWPIKNKEEKIISCLFGSPK